MRVSEIRGTFLGSLFIWGSILGVPYFCKPPYRDSEGVMKGNLRAPAPAKLGKHVMMRAPSGGVGYFLRETRTPKQG